ncbi:MAG TPA: helix-turn-helix domain-containing protein, partial [Longimicrobium sp.]
MPQAAAMLSQIQALLEHRLGVPVQMVPIARRNETGADATMRFVVEGQIRDLLVRTMATRKRTALETRPPSSVGWLLAAPELSASVREEMRKRNLNYADLAGNVFIHEPGLYVMLQGDRKPPRPHPSSGRQLNPFSKKASLLLRALLEEPGRGWGVRELAAETRLSVGHASEIAQVLIQRGYARDENGRISLNNGVVALRDWSAVYEWTKNRISSFVVPFDRDEVGPKLQRAMDAARIPFAFTLLAGADLVAPHVQHGQTHLYVPADELEHSAGVVREALYGEP